MVCPAALAETVTPPSFSPVADAIAPLSSASAAAAAAGNASGMAASAIAIAATEDSIGCRLAMSSPSARGIGGGLRRCWNGLEVGGDRDDLRLVELKLEPRHPRRAVADHVLDDALLTAERFARERGTELYAGDLRLLVTDDAVIAEQPATQFLRLIEAVIGRGLRLRNLRPCGQQQYSEPPPASHRAPPLTLLDETMPNAWGREAPREAEAASGFQRIKHAAAICPLGQVDLDRCSAGSKGPTACRSRRYNRGYRRARLQSGSRGLGAAALRARLAA